MSRAQQLLIEQQESTIAGLREQVSGLKGELTGERRGKSRVTEQLAGDIAQHAVRANGYGQARDRAQADVRRLLHILAGHVLDERIADHLRDDRIGSSSAVEILVDTVTLAGFNLNVHLALVGAERAEATAKAGGHMSAAALADAPVPHRTA